MVKKILLIGLVVILILGAIYFWPKGGPVSNGDTAQTGAQGTETKGPAPENVEVPDENATDLPENVAVPESVVDAGPDTDLKLRLFDLAYVNGKFDPDTIIVREGDRVQLRFAGGPTAYDFNQPDYGIAWKIPKAGVTYSFGAATPGTYTFSCESCGTDVKGKIIIAEK
jgi:plastocyanin